MMSFHSIFTSLMAFIVAIPLCCCGVTLSASPNTEPVSSCCSSNTTDENPPCEENCSCNALSKDKFFSETKPLEERNFKSKCSVPLPFFDILVVFSDYKECFTKPPPKVFSQASIQIKQCVFRL